MAWLPGYQISKAVEDSGVEGSRTCCIHHCHPAISFWKPDKVNVPIEHIVGSMLGQRRRTLARHLTDFQLTFPGRYPESLDLRGVSVLAVSSGMFHFLDFLACFSPSDTTVDLGLYCPLGYERVYVPLCKVAHTPFHIRGNDMLRNSPVMMDRCGCRIAVIRSDDCNGTTP